MEEQPNITAECQLTAIAWQPEDPQQKVSCDTFLPETMGHIIQKVMLIMRNSDIYITSLTYRFWKHCSGIQSRLKTKTLS